MKHTLPDGSDRAGQPGRGYVPLLELDDGTRIAESNDPLQYVADLKPGTIAPAFGTIERWKRWSGLGFISTEIHRGGPLWNLASGPAVTRARSLR